MSQITEKQMDCITFIENNLGIVFKGNNSYEAWKWIKLNMEKSKRVSEQEKLNKTIEYVSEKEHEAADIERITARALFGGYYD